MQRELLVLHSRLRPPLPDGIGDNRQIAALNAEIAVFGYSFGPDILDQLRDLSPVTFGGWRQAILSLLGEVSGATANHAVLFNGFPYDTPDQWDYLTRRIIGHLQTVMGLPSWRGRPLSCGHVIDVQLFDVDAFGACPICQRQVPEIQSRDNVRYPLDSLTPLKVIEAADDAFVAAQAQALLDRQSSLSMDERSLLAQAIPICRLTVPERLYRETLPFAYRVLYSDPERVAPLLASATDVLRIAVLLSDLKGDLSLKEPTRFKLATRHKKALLTLLDGFADPLEDMLRHRERWLRLGERLNPGSDENRRRWPRAAEAFDRLRNRPADKPTFNRQVEAAIRTGAVSDRLLDLLSTRPGEFLRRLDLLLRRAADGAPVLATLERCLAAAATPMLFTLAKYLKARPIPPADQRGFLARILKPRPASGERVFFPKGQVNKAWIAPDRRPGIAAERLAAALALVEAELDQRLAKMPPLGRVHIAPRLADQMAPFNRRGDSATAAPVTKGSRYPYRTCDVIRLFVHWYGEIDVDLSIVCFDADFRMISQVSYTNLQDYGCVHSGDIQRAPDGGSEFIDFDLADIQAKGVRYVVSSVISFSGTPFSRFPCFAGFMERDGLKSGARYEPETVQLKFDLDSACTSHLPLIFDLQAREVIFADMASSSRFYQQASRGAAKLAATARVMLNLRDTKPTVRDILVAHARARGELVEDAASADRVFDAVPADLDAWIAGN